MSVQYISDKSGHTTAVVVPIDEWNEIKEKYPDVAQFEDSLPQWQKDLIDARLLLAEQFPDRLRPIEELLEALNRDDE